MRILVDLPQAQVDALKAAAKNAGLPRAGIIREAVGFYLKTHRETIEKYFGLWADNPETQNVQAYLGRIRGEWEE